MRSKNELEDLMQEEQELMRNLNEADKKLAAEKSEREERLKRIKLLRDDNQALKSTLELAECEMAHKDAEYDKQLKSGKQMDNLPQRHAQRIQELENLQNVFVDLENKKDELHMRLMQRTNDVKETIAGANELVNKIKLSSSLALDEFPQLDVLDFHRAAKQELVKQYKECFLRIRHKYNQSMCELPKQLAECREKRKEIEAEMEASQAKKAHLHTENKKLEAYNEQLQVVSRVFCVLFCFANSPLIDNHLDWMSVLGCRRCAQHAQH